jgi:hypothetical protein
VEEDRLIELAPHELGEPHVRAVAPVPVPAAGAGLDRRDDRFARRHHAEAEIGRQRGGAVVVDAIPLDAVAMDRRVAAARECMQSPPGLGLAGGKARGRVAGREIVGDDRAGHGGEPLRGAEEIVASRKTGGQPGASIRREHRVRRAVGLHDGGGMMHGRTADQLERHHMPHRGLATPRERAHVGLRDHDVGPGGVDERGQHVARTADADDESRAAHGEIAIELTQPGEEKRLPARGMAVETAREQLRIDDEDRHDRPVARGRPRERGVVVEPDVAADPPDRGPCSVAHRHAPTRSALRTGFA